MKNLIKLTNIAKKPLLTSFVLSLLLSSNTFAGSGGIHNGDHGHAEDKAKPACTAEHAALGHCEMDKSSSHGHGAGHGHGADHGGSVGMAVDSSKASQTVNVDMLDTMRFVFNEKFEIKPGKVVQFKVTNKGKIRHEFAIGNISQTESHAKVMMENPNMSHGDGEAAITVEPGETKTLTWSFAGNEEIVFACTLPGHYQAGMFYKQAVVN